MESKKDILKTATRYAQSGEWEKVIKEYLKLLQLDPNDISLYNSLGDAYAKLNEHRKAFECYLKVLEDYKNKNNEIRLNLLYKKIAKLNPRKFDLEGKALHEKVSKVVTALSLYDKGDDDNALPAFKEALKVEPYNPFLLEKYGEICEKKTIIGDAVESYVKAIHIYTEKKQHEKALFLAKKVLNLDKTNRTASSILAEDLLKKGEKDKAEEMFKEILIELGEKNLIKEGIDVSKRAMENKISIGKQFYAYFLFKNNSIDEAKKILENSPSLSEEEKLLLGKIYFKTQEYEKSKDIILSLSPNIINNHSEILDLIGDIFLKLRDYKKAGEYYTKALKLLFEEEKYDACITMASKILNVDTENEILYEIMIKVYTKKGMKVELINSYEKLADIFDKEGKKEEAIKIRQIITKLKMI